MNMDAVGGTHDELMAVRAAIDELDERLVHLFAERVELAAQARRVKEGPGLPELDPAREAHIVRRACELARTLEAELVRAIFWRLVGLSRGQRARAVAPPVS